MRIANLIITLIVSIFLTIQSFAVMAAGSLSESFSESASEKAQGESLSGGGACGIVAAILWVVAAAFVMAKPKVSMWVFAVAGVFCFLGAAASEFSDLWIYGGISAAFFAMARAGVKEKAKAEERDQVRYQADLALAAQALNKQ